MRKLLVVGALAIIALLVFMLHEIRSQVDAAPIAPPPSPVPTIAPPPPARPPIKIAAPAPEPGSDAKVNANSDEFLDRFIDRQPRMASRAAMSCYHGGLHRRTMNQWIRFSFVGHIRNGEVTFSDVKTQESRLDDKELEDCMLAAVANAHWHDDSLPDTESYPDQTTLNPERGGKKYLHDSDDDATPAPPDTPR
ncbi:MAG TPA: hypothetical protein VH143_34550 [Kofleriaceae bacterium]|jgi:hypothetical protein|nr:hypothetical protein [Kofleriaceae bacterium]